MKKILSSLSLCLILGLGVSSCKSDDVTELNIPSDIQITNIIPIEFGLDRTALAEKYASLSLQYDSTTVKVKGKDTLQIDTVLVFNTDDAKYKSVFGKVELHFDGNAKYRFAKIPVLSFEAVSSPEFANLLVSDGWQPYTEVVAKDGEKLYKKDNAIMRIFTERSTLIEMPVILVSENNQGVISQTRITTLTDEQTGFSLPLANLGGDLFSVRAFAQLHGYVIDLDRSKIPQGRYTYNTGNANCPVASYWLDNTQSFVEEATVEFPFEKTINKDSVATEEAKAFEQKVLDYVANLGFKPTGLKDRSGNPIYYNWQTKVTCLVQLRTSTATYFPEAFRPNITFMFNPNIDKSVPQEFVKVPLVVTGFETETLDNVVNKYKEAGYEVQVLEGTNTVITKNEDFPLIFLFASDKDATKFGASFVMAKDGKTLFSPSLITWLIENGYKLNPAKATPTYINESINSECQINISDEMPGLGFNQIGAQ